MRFIEWEPIYKQILADFEFDRNKDEDAANILKKLLKSKEVQTNSNLLELIEDKQINIFGAGPTLETDIENSDFQGVIIAADGATSPLMNKGIVPDIIVTDLDGYIPDQINANEQGATIIIHAHGDNIDALNHWVPKFKSNLLGTTQAQPDEKNNIYNFGGFTDGDRAVFLAAHFNARQIILVAFDFKNIGKYSFKFNSEIKLRKLTWSNLLIGMIEKPPIVFYGDESD